MAGALYAQSPAAAVQTESRLLTIEGVVEVYPAGGTGWGAARTNQILHLGDRLRTGPRSRATARLSDLTLLRVNELTTLQIRPPGQAGKSALLEVNSGSTYFNSRERPARQEFRTPLTSGAIRGTEFNLAVAEDGRTRLALVDGAVTLSNALGQVDISSGDQGVVDPGKAPARTAMLEAVNNIIQWCLYYPGVLDVQETGLDADDRELADSVSAYRQGDLLQALARYPAGRAPVSDPERVYRAATLLAVGQVSQAEALLSKLPAGDAGTTARLAAALREVVAVVKGQPVVRPAMAGLATEWLAESYYLQSQGKLAEALQAAQSAVDKSPGFGFGWARVAELEMSFGRRSRASAALERSLAVSPRNPQSLAVKGFILLADHRASAAQKTFDEAIAIDGALANAWLGRGLAQIARGHAAAGRQDLHVAAVLEPQRAVLRSYLAKAFSNAGDNRRALKELDLAQRFDPNDPTALLYRALVEEQENNINQAVRDLEQSQKLNDNRRLFRSRLLLDQDQAVRGANLANIYQDTGILNWSKDVAMSDWSVREASRAVNYDYANFSAHQFLANSYDALRDPHQVNLRYETPWYSELLMANLLAPVGAGSLSEFSAQQAYSRLFEGNHFGASSDTEYLSHGDWLERASHYGTWDKVTYSVDLDYRSERGWRPNNDLERATVTVKAKDQLTPQDSILLEGIYYWSEFGDTLQYYNQDGTMPGVRAPSATFRGRERQWGNLDDPNLLLGYHHEWGPGLHTLFLGGRLDDVLDYREPNGGIPFVFYRNGGVNSVIPLRFSLGYEREFEAYTAEVQQIYQTEYQTLVFGGRYQAGWNSTSAQGAEGFGRFSFTQDFETDQERYGVYAYETVKLLHQLELTAGLSYDHLRYPRNVDLPPISTEERDTTQVSPKAGIIWTPRPDTHLRFAYTRSLGGVYYDSSLRLEPTQVAGFNQAFRSLIPESVAGLVPGTRFTTYDFGLEQSLHSNTYLSVALQWLESDGTRSYGVVTNSPDPDINFFPIPGATSTTRQDLDFTEKSLVVSLSQLVADQWSVGGRYQLSHADLQGRFPAIPASTPGISSLNQDQNATLNQLALYLNYYHPCGFFAQFQSLWTAQSNRGYTPDIPGDDFWQFNLYGGYRFLHRAAEVKLGLLNISDQDYQLNPLNLYYDLPRGRTLAVSFKFYF